MTQSDKLRLEVDAVEGVLDSVRFLAEDTRTRGNALVAAMTANGFGADPAGVAAARLFDSLNGAVARRSEALSSHLHDQASAAHEVVRITVDRDAASAVELSKVCPE